MLGARRVRAVIGIAAIFLLRGPILPCQDPPPRPPATELSDLPAGVVARVDGRDVGIEEYQQFLFRSMDRTRLLDFIDEILVQKEAQELGIEVTDEELADIVDRQLQSKIERMYRGDRKAFEVALSRRLQSYERHRAWQIDLERPRTLLRKCIMKTRSVTDEDVQKQFEKIYGAGGVHVQIRHILIRTPRSGVPASDPDRNPQALATELMQKLEENPDQFVELVQAHSEDPLTRRNEGFIPTYRPGFYGAEFDDAVRGLENEGQIAGPIRSNQGYHIIQLVRRHTTRFEDVQLEIREELLRQPPTPQEIAAFKKKLREAAKIEL